MTAPADPSRWADLGPRATSAAVMIAVGTGCVVAGGVWFQMVTVFVTAIMIWELWTMIEPQGPTRGMLLAAMVASVLSGQLALQETWGLSLFLLASLAGALTLRRERMTFFFFALAVQLAGWGLVTFRTDYGFFWILWLIGVVVITDIAGYFAGRLIGGPKFWPRVSPKKTWSGTVAGWVGAAGVGLLFDQFAQVGPEIVPLSIALSMASQWGDIAESALKRRMGVKDSSALIPGHGGLFDRFDAMLGASLFMLLVSALAGVPVVSS
ncbi:phosphatidate cytidylyltransferase [Rubellimicrobium rubrum]|uniref:Phosphatidate cytidylyltransferase n=1 Tax=Rubellimicrobium rubrum TaxID=2585369 RepID=A0A5C4N4C6_9RHOB|nr:phosphatidate cytidylyltransferase [Rubellimicrobium rubrum]TNC51124.1 phosphatidate cytidylyltransferase [Rubellimicrobium rubrum]